MKLSCALVACNENPNYLEFWPYVKRAWWEIVGIPCVMVYVGTELPAHLKDDPSVLHFPPIAEWPTATQAQVIRLLYPALLKCDGAVVLSDMDIIPLQRDFFVEGFGQFKDDQVVSLRGIDENEQQIYMCYVGATPKTWAELFQIGSMDDIVNCMRQLASQVKSDGEHGGYGWCTDQRLLYTVVKNWQTTQPNRVGLIPWTAEFPRLDRDAPEKWLHLHDELKTELQSKQYVDFHMPPLRFCAGHLECILTTLQGD
jgi:hypothetical protein